MTSFFISLIYLRKLVE